MAETVTPTMQDYLGLIYLQQREGQTVIAARLAGRLHVSRPTVSATLQRLERAGLICLNERKEISLTAAGLAVAEDLLRRHMLTERLLHDVVGLPWHEVHAEADRLEHHLSPQTLERMEALFQQPDTCPHGNPMPGAVPAEALPLDAMHEGAEATVVRIVEEAEEQHDLLDFFEENGLVPGALLRVLVHRPYNETLTVELAGRPVVLGLATARFVRVQPVGPL